MSVVGQWRQAYRRYQSTVPRSNPYVTPDSIRAAQYYGRRAREMLHSWNRDRSTPSRAPRRASTASRATTASVTRPSIAGGNLVASSGYRGAKKTYKRRKLTPKQKRRKKTWKKFSNKVQQVITKAKPYGHRTIVQAMRLHQDTNNLWKTFEENPDPTFPNLGFHFFQPAQFKDAEAVLFNGKTDNPNGYLLTSVAAAGNLATNTITHVVNSHVNWKFVNTSQHPTYLEMYICQATKGARQSNAPTTPLQLWVDTVTTVNLGGGLDANPTTNLTSSVRQAKGMLAAYDYKLIKIKLEPGQVATQFMQGPKNYRMDGSKKIQPGSPDIDTPTWRDFSTQGCGMTVFFRVLNEMTLSGEGTPCHFPHSQVEGNVGGIAMTYYTYYQIRGPNTDSVDDDIQNSIFGFTNLQSNLDTGDNQVDPDNPSTIPATPL